MKNINILVPNLPESVIDATVAVWHKKVGDNVHKNEILVELETDKIMLEVPSPESGILELLLEQEGAIVKSGQILGQIVVNLTLQEKITNEGKNKLSEKISLDIGTTDSNKDYPHKEVASPSAKKFAAEHNIEIKNIQGSGVGGRITRFDVEKHMVKQQEIFSENKIYKVTNRNETRVPMTRLRKKIAERLLNVKNNTAILTTFNEVNMQSIIDIRKKYGEKFEKKYNIRLGLMSFFVQASLEALKQFPEINASIDGEEVIYRDYCDISIAVSTSRGLVTPVIKNVNLLCNIYEIEKHIKDLTIKGRDGKLTIEDLNGGSFTITNGGIFGSLMSTPIINPPQSAILGMHSIKERPMAVNGQIVILPMMYLALSYDHRLIDGKESIKFLNKIKDIIEDPVRILLNI